VIDQHPNSMKRKLLNARLLKQAALAVPAAALMLGAAQAGSTVGLNFQAWYYDSGTTPQTVGYGAGYQTTGFPVTAKAFGVDVANWANADPMPCSSAISGYATFGGVDTQFAGGLTAQVTAPNAWQSAIGELANGWAPETVPPGNDEATWGYLDDGNATGGHPSVTLAGLAAKFPNGYVVQTIAANSGKKTFDAVDITDGVTTNTVAYSTYYKANISIAETSGGTVGISAPSGRFTTDTINIYCLPKTSANRSVLAGFIITDQPVVSQAPSSAALNSGGSLTLSGSAIGIPPLDYQWRHAGTNIPGAITATYTKASVAPEDAGDYQLVATNLYGSGTSVVATVSVATAPAIVTDVQSATNYATLSQRFAVASGGAVPLSYQWTHAGTNLPGATTASLLLKNLQAADAGDYQMIVTNTLGAATSSVATLTLVASLPYEGFAYADGDIAGQNGGTGWAGAWTQSWTSGGNAVASPGATYQDAAGDLVVSGSQLQMGANGAADFGSDRTLAATVGGAGTVFISFIGAFPTGGWEGIEILQDTTFRAFLGQGWPSEPWGCGSFPYPEILTSKASTLLSYVVYRFDYTETNTQVRIYVNPSLASEPTTADATGTMGLFQFNTVRIMAHALNAGTVDEFRIGGTWASVNPNTARTDPPTIVKDLPVAAYAYAGESSSFTIVAGGAPTLHYQWQKGASPVGSDSPTLTLTGLTTGSSGDYSVTVTNTHGSTNSAICHLTVVASPDLYTDQVLADAPGAYWPLNETVAATAYDYSAGGKNGSQNGALTLGVAGPRPPACAGFRSGTLAYQFDGSSAYIDCGTGPSLNGTTDFTLEAWINTTNLSGSRIIQQRSATGYNGEYMLGVNGNGTVYFTIFGSGAQQYSFNSAAGARRVNDGRWHHVAAVRGGTNGFIWIDGSVAATAASTAVAPLDSTIATYIGIDQRDGSSYFNGTMADVAIYSYALSAARIGDHAYKGVLGASSLALRKVSGGWVEDSKPAGTPYDGMNLGVSWVASATDAAATPVTRAGAAQFSSGAQIAIPANAEFNSPAGTICFWMRMGIPAAGTGMMLVDRRASTGLVMVLDGTPSGGINIQYTGNTSLAGGGYVVDENWHHVALVYDQSANGMVSLYIDGVQTGSQANTAAWSWASTQQIELARSHDTYWQEYNGQMDDFRIYNRILTDTEIGAVLASDALVDTNALKVRYNFGTAAGVGTGLSWPIGVLQSSPAVGPSAVWTPINTTSPSYPLLPPYGLTNSASFYRLKL
jgi:hypothetical protein